MMGNKNEFKNPEQLLERINCGSGVRFTYEGKNYYMWRGGEKEFTISKGRNETYREKLYETAEEMLDYSFGKKKLRDIMGEIVAEYEENFKNAEELLEHLYRGCEVEFFYEGKSYFMGRIGENKFDIGVVNDEESGQLCKTAEEVLEYSFGEKKLKDILDDMKITFRCF